MVRTIDPLGRRQCPLRVAESPLQIPFRLQDRADVARADCNIGIIESVDLLVDPERPAEHLFCCRQLCSRTQIESNLVQEKSRLLKGNSESFSVLGCGERLWNEAGRPAPGSCFINLKRECFCDNANRGRGPLPLGILVCYAVP